MAKKTKILLVDDEDLVRRSLAANLRQEGFEICAVASVEEALAELERSSCDLLLTDYLMEGMTGIDLLEITRERYPHIRVIVFSGYEDQEAAKEIARLGGDCFLAKPVDFEELLKRIAEL